MAMIIAETWLCIDCGLITANDDDSGCEDGSAHRERMAAWLQGSPGALVVSSCPTDEPCPGAHVCRIDRDFSDVTCGGCGTSLAGYRYAAVVLS